MITRRDFCQRGLASLALTGLPKWAKLAGPNIVLIMADDLGYGSLGCYGQAEIQTPNLDALAAGGRRFTQGYAPGCVCSPSRWALLTGQHIGHAPTSINTQTITEAQPTVAQALQAQGYQTACIGKWGMLHCTPNERGFDTFFGYRTNEEAHHYYPPYLWQDDKKVNVTSYAPDLLTARALQFIGQAQSPFFLYLPFNLPHVNSQTWEFEVPDQGPYSGMPWTEDEKNYAAMITRLDGYVGQIIQALPSNTIVILTSDNGSDYPQMFQSNGTLRAGKSTLYEGGIRVPLIASGPGVAPGVEDAPAWLVNFWQVAESGDVSRFATPEPMYWAFQGTGLSEAVRLGDLKGIRATGGFELYDLATDPGETVNLAGQYPEMVWQMEIIMGRYCPAPKVCRTWLPVVNK